MAKKLHWIKWKSTNKNIVLGLFIAIIFLCIEAIRFCVSTIINPTSTLEFISFFAPWGAAIIVSTIILNGFMNNLEKY